MAHPKINLDLLKKMQATCHYLGKNEFLGAVVETLYRAAEDTIDLEDKTVSEGYQIAAGFIQELLDECEREIA